MQNPSLATVLSPQLLNLYTIDDSIVVIIDVFRATSTIATALYNGAEKIIPVTTKEECLATGKLHNAVTAGEREGKIMEGLQHGNSPAEYPKKFIQNKTLVLTTTNGTKLIHIAIEHNAAQVITGSFPNLSSVCDYIISQNKNVLLACSAWKNIVNAEDSLFAGAVINRVKDFFTIHCDSSLMAEDIYTTHKNNLASFAKKFTHWQRLASYGLGKDLNYCLTTDVANTLPVYDNGILKRYND